MATYGPWILHINTHIAFTANVDTNIKIYLEATATAADPYIKCWLSVSGAMFPGSVGVYTFVVFMSADVQVYRRVSHIG